MDNISYMQTLTAYKYKIIDVNTKEPLISGDGSNGTIDIHKLLMEFSAYMEKTQFSTNTKKVISLKLMNEETSTVSSKRVHFKATSGRYGQRTIALDINNEKNKTELGTEKAICHFYNVFFYIENRSYENICIFHRYGRGGCKTIFIEIFNKFLRLRDMKIELSALFSPEQQNNIVNSQKTKLRLLKNTIKHIESADVADNIESKKTIKHNTEMELTINLKNKKVVDRLPIDGIKDVILGRKKVIDVFEIPEDFLFDQAKMEMKLGNQIRTIDLANLGKIFCEYDITEKLEYDSQNEPTYQTILHEADCYYLVHKKRSMVV